MTEIRDLILTNDMPDIFNRTSSGTATDISAEKVMRIVAERDTLRAQVRELEDDLKNARQLVYELTRGGDRAGL